MTSGQRWKQRPHGSNWGEFGADDEYGRMNLLTPEKILQGIAEVRVGLSFNLSLPLDFPGGTALNPRRLPPILRPTLRGDVANMNFAVGAERRGATDVISDDLAILHMQYSTHWDSLAHVGSTFDATLSGKPSTTYYNGYAGHRHVRGPADGSGAGLFPDGVVDRASTSMAERLGIENMSERCVQGRAVLIDLHAHFGRAPVVVDYPALADVMMQDNIAVEPGDMVLFHTGYAQMLLEMNREPDAGKLRLSCPSLDGADHRLLSWITETGLSAIAADNIAVEAVPEEVNDCCGAWLPLHEHCIFKLGVHLGELWHLTPLADWLRRNGRNRFLLTAPPLRLPGAVGSPCTPIATV